MATIHRHDLGLTWVMDDALQRGSHALVADDGRVWLVDPVRDEEVMAAIAALGPPAGVLRLLDRHDRDGKSIAAQLGVPLLVDDAVQEAELPFAVRRVVWNPLWHELALWWPQRKALVVAESLGTNTTAFAVGDGPVGVHPLRRLLPPGMLRGLGAEHLLVGHGPPLHGPQVGAQVDRAIARSRHDVPRLVAKLPALLRSSR